MAIACGSDSLVFNIYENRVVFSLVMLHVRKEDLKEKMNLDNYVLLNLV